MFKNILVSILGKVLGGDKLNKLIIALYRIVKPIDSAVSFILEQLRSGTITQTLIDYTVEVQAAVGTVLDIIQNIAGFFNIVLPEKTDFPTEDINVPVSRSPDSISKKIENLRAARKYASSILSK
jgi:hypothetical protein